MLNGPVMRPARRPLPASDTRHATRGRRRAPLAAVLRGLALGLFPLGLLLGAFSCAHTAEQDDIPTLHMDARPEEGAPVPPAHCTAEERIERIKGAVPSDAVVIVRMTVKADRAVPFWMFERAVQERAAWYCCDGVSVTQAVAEDGEALFHEIEATGWRKVAPVEGE